MMEPMPANLRLIMRVIFPFLIVLAAILIPLLTQRDDNARDPDNGAQVFRDLWRDPIPEGVRDLVSVGMVNDEEYFVYMRFNAPRGLVEDYVASKGYVETECDSNMGDGGIATDIDLIRRIPEWRPFEANPIVCYTTAGPIQTGWSEAAQSFIVHHPETGVVYYNEIGR